MTQTERTLIADLFLLISNDNGQDEEETPEEALELLREIRKEVIHVSVKLLFETKE